jgi:hypothetical protein
MGPSDASGAAWALGTLFPFFHVLFIFYVVIVGSINGVKGRGELGKATTTKTGSNDASGVVWALGTIF